MHPTSLPESVVRTRFESNRKIRLYVLMEAVPNCGEVEVEMWVQGEQESRVSREILVCYQSMIHRRR